MEEESCLFIKTKPRTFFVFTFDLIPSKISKKKLNPIFRNIFQEFPNPFLHEPYSLSVYLSRYTSIKLSCTKDINRVHMAESDVREQIQ